MACEQLGHGERKSKARGRGHRRIAGSPWPRPRRCFCRSRSSNLAAASQEDRRRTERGTPTARQRGRQRASRIQGRELADCGSRPSPRRRRPRLEAGSTPAPAAHDQAPPGLRSQAREVVGNIKDDAWLSGAEAGRDG